ncbi:MAG: hypothetical protein IJ302_01410, partial [Clostridia bacterium]|nr:hypothetical protein [Clostridia bacterium]
RFLSYYADEAGGTLTTKPLLFETDVIHINFATSAYGSVQVTVLDYDGTPIAASDEIYGNELSYPLTFDGLAGRTGRLCITLKEAHLYALGAPMV